MVYKVIGLMSGSSLDGLDIAYVQFEETRGKWQYEILCADCIPYTEYWEQALRHCSTYSVSNFLRLHTSYGRYLGSAVNDFINRHSLQHQVHFIASHGHTVFHDPANETTFQLGDGASLGANVVLPVISDLRNVDVALGGQGAPIVPIGDQLLFGSYPLLLNLGGIANITIKRDAGALAFDICPANQVLNALANKLGKTMDEGGALAAQGQLLGSVLHELDNNDFYKQPPPRSLSNEAAMDMAFPALLESPHSPQDLLSTYCVHIAGRVAAAVKQFSSLDGPAEVLVTGGGAFNTYLVAQIQEHLSPLEVTVVVPEAMTVKYKEALVMALIGTLRWREETNVLMTVTGASRDSCGGALWMGN